jgi:hypothetical protein
MLLHHTVNFGDVLPTVSFQLYEYDVNGNTTMRQYEGPWLIVHNGYLKWSMTVPPINIHTNAAEHHWSKWLETLQKDVECTFGILKDQWRILKTGIRQQGMEVTNKIWKTCCALHNEVDGIDGEGMGAIGQHDQLDIMQHAPLALQQLQLGFDPRSYDVSGIGYGDDYCNVTATMEMVNVTKQNSDVVQNENDEASTVRIVRYLSLQYFRKKLIEHFDIMFKRYQLVWPKHRDTIH